MVRRQFLSILATLPCLSWVRPSDPPTEESGEADSDKGQWFAYCPENGMELFDTRDEAIKFAGELIESYLDDCWDENVTQACVGCITDEATMTNYIGPEMLDDEGDYNGRNYPRVASGEWGHHCNYEMLPVN